MLKTTRDKKGWLLPYLLALDDLFFKRWSYWSEICFNNHIPRQPIPFIPFKSSASYPQKLVFKNIMSCLDHERYSSYALENFVDWMLWGFKQGDVFPNINEKTDDFWYRTFNLGLFYKEPADHWPDIYLEVKGSKNSNSFFPTPASVVEMMTRMTFGDTPQHHHKHKSVLDPCCGTGVMLLFASNYSLNLYGQDIALLLTKIATINAFIYMPWMVCKPKHLTIFNKDIEEVELPTGVRVPRCKCCSKNSFYMDLLTPAHIQTNGDSLDIKYPKAAADLVAHNIIPENIHCSTCLKEEK